MTELPPRSSCSVIELVPAVEQRFGKLVLDIVGEQSALITSITHNSASVGPNSMFVCVRGSSSNGHDYASDAVSRGASCLLVDHFIDGLDPVTQIVVKDTRAEMGRFAAGVYGFPADRLTLIGVTGTNGKTTTAHTIESIVRGAGRHVEVIGTLTQKRTTPEATDIHERLAVLAQSGCEFVVMEVTSHALDLHRVRGLHFAVAVFTNLSQDHLDFHGTIEAYFRSKAKLFTAEFSDRAIVNGDDRYGRLLFDSAEIPTETVSLSAVDDLRLGSRGSTYRWNGQHFAVPIAGAFNVMNALQASSVARLLGIGWDSIVAGISAVRVPGRFEPVDAGQPFAVYVDFAHTPDGLERVLGAARETAGSGRLISVFGCGGDRDRAKRPLMGEIGVRLSDVAYFTSDNPRSEEIEAILNDMLLGVSERQNVRVVPDRRMAIESALRDAHPGDVVVIAGKGHEQGQVSAGIVTPFDDRNVAREILRDLGWVA